MTTKEFVTEIMPSVHEIIDGCLEMTDEEYREYLEEERKYLEEVNDPRVTGFFEELFKLAEEYRQREAGAQV